MRIISLCTIKTARGFAHGAVGLALAAVTLGVLAPQAEAVHATGGTTTITNGMVYHTFTYPGGTLDVTSPGKIEHLIVAGGGGGGYNIGGGGGAGGVLTGAVQVAKQSYTVTVGNGGSGVLSGLLAGENGENSAIVGLVGPAIGGGGGSSATTAAQNLVNPAKDGGSGGGAGCRYLTDDGGAGTPGQGYAGGGCNYTDSTHDSGAGGGGASAPGEDGHASLDDGSNGGYGGDGVEWPTSSGNYYGGGGGGGGYDGPGANRGRP